MQSLLLVFIGGGIGSVARFGISKLFLSFWDNKLSATAATLTSNIAASAILIFVWVLIDQGKLPQNLKFFLLVGFCGGFSTFSTFSFETLQLLRQGNFALAVFNVVFSVGICLLAMYWLYKKLI